MNSIIKYISLSSFIFILLSCSVESNDSESQDQPRNNSSNLQQINTETLKSSSSTQIITNSQNGIWVNGTSKIMVEPNLVEINVGIESTNLIVSKSVTTVSKDNSKLLKILNQNSIDKNDIKTTRYTITPQYKYNQGKSDLTGYKVSHFTSFKYREINNIGKLIDQISIGPNSIGNNLRINSINFSIENPSEYEDILRKNAILNAKDKAGKLANYSNVVLGSPFYISENSPTNFTQILPESDMMIAKMANSVPSTEINSGQLTITFNVNIGFGINNK